MSEVELLADRVGIIAGGRLVAEGTPTDLKAHVGEPTLHLELADPEAAPRAREALAGLGAVEPASEGAPTRVALRARNGKGAIAPAVQALQAGGIQVESVEVESPSLDDVFAAVTGSTLEGDAAEQSPSAACAPRPRRSTSSAGGASPGEMAPKAPSVPALPPFGSAWRTGRPTPTSCACRAMRSG